MDSPDLTVALPAYQEGPNLAELLPELRRVLDGLGLRYEILVADTPTPMDDTPAVCAANGVRYVPRVGGTTYSHAVNTAIAASRGRHVVFMDADGSHDPAFVARLWAERGNADIVIASRYAPGGRTENPAVLIGMSLMVNVVFRAVLDQPRGHVAAHEPAATGDEPGPCPFRHGALRSMSRLSRWRRRRVPTYPIAKVTRFRFVRPARRFPNVEGISFTR